MLSPHSILAVFAILVALGLSFGLTITLGSYLRYGGKRIVKCPETRQSAIVHIDLVKATQETINRSTNITLDPVFPVAGAGLLWAGMSGGN